MSDLIKRQDAIDVLNRGLSKIPYVNNTDTEMIRRDERICCIQEVAGLPTVPRKGKWTRHFDGNEWYWYCSSCKEQWYEEELWMGGNSFPNFCPNCGSYNGGEQTG